ncbi:hypothetical protein HDU97_004179 [Phlyctochytrium planicorne]|nr:hypothetical protein HDU97_004179 [Phlyctochytrium planicorne]
MATTVTTPDGGSAQCFALTGSKTCPDYANYYVLAEGNIVDVASFDTFMGNQADSSPAFISLFNSSFMCPGFAGTGLRYHASTLCNFFINFSQDKCGSLNKAPYQPYCQNSCLNFINSVTTQFSTPSVCPAFPDQRSDMNRTAFKTPGNVPVMNNLYYAYCNTLTSNNTNTCQPGLKSEVATFGFTVATDAVAYCTTNLNTEPGCPDFIDTFSKSLVHLLDPPNQLPWIASAGALGFMGLIYMCLLCAIGTKRWTKATTIAHQPAPEQLDTGYRTGTILRGASNTIRRSQIMNNYGSTGNKDTKRASIFSSVRASFARAKGGNPYPNNANNGRFDPQTANPNDDNNSLLVKMRAVENYPAQLSDELDLRRGDIIIIEEMFDDGWAIGRNEATGQSGALPVSCLVPINQKAGGNRRSVVNQRTASLYAGRPDN